MRAFVLAALVLVACSKPAPTQPAQSPAPSPYPDAAQIAAGFTDLTASGDGWRLDVNPFYGMVMTEGGRSTFTDDDRPQIDGSAATAYTYSAPGLSTALRRADCTLKGVVYPLTATITRPNKPTLNGCAFEQWDGRVSPAVRIADACAPVGPNARRITLFQISSGNVMLVRLRGEAGGVDCRIANGQLTATPRDAALKVGGEGELDLIRAPADAPTEQCIADMVMADDGHTTGWLVPKDGACHMQPLTP